MGWRDPDDWGEIAAPASNRRVAKRKRHFHLKRQLAVAVCQIRTWFVNLASQVSHLVHLYACASFYSGVPSRALDRESLLRADDAKAGGPEASRASSEKAKRSADERRWRPRMGYPCRASRSWSALPRVIL